MSNNSVEYLLSLKDKFSSGIKNATKETEKLNGAMGTATRTAKMLGAAIGAIGGGLIAREIVNVTAAMEGLKNQLNFASGSAEQGGRDFEYLKNITKEMGLDFKTSADAFAKFSGAARGTMLEGQGVRDVFESVGMASTVMHLSAEQSEGAFRALEQMLSKGKVQAEELRGQLGERIPGAFLIAARAMGMTTMELDKFMSEGKLMAEEFLPKFAAQLKTEFAGGMDKASQSLSANLNRMNNEFLMLKYTLGDLFMPIIQGMIVGITKLTGFIKEHSVAISFLGGAIAGAAGALLIYNTYLAITKAIMVGKLVYAVWSLAAALEGTTIAQWLLNSATAFFAGLTGVGIFAVAAGAAAALAVGIMAAKYAQDKLNSSISDQPQGAASSLNPMKQGMTAKPAGQSPNQTKAGTSTTAVESKGVQNFNISINKLVEQITVKATTIKEGSSEIKDAVAEALLAAVNDFQLLATK